MCRSGEEQYIVMPLLILPFSKFLYFGRSFFHV